MKGCAYYVHTCGSGPGLDSLQFNLFLNIGFFWTRKIHISLSLRSWTCLVIRVFRDASAEIISKSAWQLLFAKFQEIGREGCSYLIKTWIEPMIQVQDIFAIIRLDSSDGKALSWAGLYLPTISVVFILASLSCFDSGPVQPASCGYFQAVHKLKHEYSLPESDPCRGDQMSQRNCCQNLNRSLGWGLSGLARSRCPRRFRTCACSSCSARWCRWCSWRCTWRAGSRSAGQRARPRTLKNKLSQLRKGSFIGQPVIGEMGGW